MAITKQYKVIEEVEIDFIYKNPSPVILCPQFENGERAIKVKLKNGGEDFTVPSGYTPHVYMLKFDKKVVDNICEYDGNAVMVKITKQMSFVEGRNLMRIALVSDTTGEYAQTCEIYLRVTEGADVAGAEHSTDEFEALVQYANQAKDSANKAAQSETNAKASETAAIAARKGAEDAEGRVQAIVAGNESYTKQQSHDLFALALRGTAEAAKSITIYPDKGSNVVATINGFTKQEGSGDASLANQRPIVNGGLKLVKLVLTGTENVTMRTDLTSNLFTVPVPGSVPRTQICNYYKSVSADWSQFPDKSCQMVDNVVGFKDAEFSSAANFKSMLAARYAAGDPVIVWYQPADESQATGLYAPLTGTGDGHTGACGELTAPLCQGDKFITKMKSGCDKKIIVDGETKKVVDGGSIYFNIPIGNNNGVAGSTVYKNYGGDAYNSGHNIQLNRLYYEMYGRTPEEFNEYCKEHPLIVWYRSTSYTESSDIALSVEIHSKNYFELAISDMNNEESYPGWYISGLASIVGSDKNQVVSKAVCNITTMVLVNTNTGRNVLFLSNIGGLTQSQLKEQYPDLVAQIVVPRSATITYAHDPIDFIADPDEEGAWVITGEADGTVSAEYNKNITKALEDILTRVSALELHALGG